MGIILLGHSTLGVRLLLQSAESACQRLCAKRGALLKPRTSGLTAQRCAEVDTVVLAHFDPRPVSKEDASALARLRALHGLDVKVGKRNLPRALAGCSRPLAILKSPTRP